ncbi:MAG: glycosyltransferase [Capsulimonadaceae bacterium]|nr:glycosyltransferase [Capsulimonadaceae bacterium]
MSGKVNKVSVIIPLYNKAAFIKRAIDSVLSQTLQDFEIIVVDDGSQDAGADIVASISDSRIKLIRQENAGVAAARNVGIDASSSELLAFLDADDKYCNTFLEKTVSVMVAYPDVSLVFTNYVNYYADKDLSINQTGLGIPSGIIGDYFDFSVRRGGLVSSSSVLIRKTIFERSGKFPVGVRHSEDTDTWYRIAWTGIFYYISEVLAYYYRDVVGSAVNSATCEDARCHIEYREKTFNEWLNTGRIPPKLMKSTRAAIQREQLGYVRLLVYSSRLKEGTHVLFSCGVPARANILLYLEICARFISPKFIIQFMKAIKASINNVRYNCRRQERR